MTIRHTLHATVLSAALAFGCVALPDTVSAASAPVPSFADTGTDSLAGYAAGALDQWAVYRATGSEKALAAFNATRDGVAAEAASRLGLDPAAMQAAWHDADIEHQVALMAAFTQLGTPYRGYTATPGVGFDCSGLTSWAWAQAGVSIFHQSRTQINSSRAATRESAQPGDLVYYPGHIMMYLGVEGAIIHSPRTGRNVELSFVAKRRANSARYGDPTG